MLDKILLVDDEANILTAYSRSIGKHFDIDTAESGPQGLEAIKNNGPYAVIVSDFRMPEMNGVDFLKEASQVAPDTVRMILTGYAEQETAIQAVNEGHVFRFLTKPILPPALIQSLQAGVYQYRLIVAEKELLQKTLAGVIKTLCDVISITNPMAFGRSARVEKIVGQLASELKVEKLWLINMATMLSQIGSVAVPENIMEKVCNGMPLSPEEESIFNIHPETGRQLIQNLPRLESIAEIIAYQQKNFDGSGSPQGGLSGTDIPLGARLLKVALDFDFLHVSGLPHHEAITILRKREGRYDMEIVAALSSIVSEVILEPVTHKKLKVQELVPGMEPVEDICTKSGATIVKKGAVLTEATCMGLTKLMEAGIQLKEPISVLPVKSV